MRYEDAPRLLWERSGIHVARKDYRCFYCSETIPTGTRYYKNIYMTTDDDRPYTYREHLNCSEDHLL